LAVFFIHLGSFIVREIVRDWQWWRRWSGGEDAIASVA
jgi:hypothetical protein